MLKSLRLKASDVILFGAIAFSAGTVMAASPYPPNLFAVNELHFDSYRQACDLNCILSGRTLHDFAGAMATAMGIDPAYMKVGLALAYPPPQVNGEETTYAVNYPPGYRFCSASINLTSIMSASNDPARGTLVAAVAHPNHLDVYTWTANPRPGEGQSSAEGWAKVTGILPQYYEEFKNKNVCSAKDEAASKEFMRCRGQACTAAQEGGAVVAGNAAPDLKTPPLGY
jgi:hypothetical protein